jgi:hypothetical protein
MLKTSYNKGMSIAFISYKRSINDVVQFNAYLRAELGDTFKYVNYMPKTGAIIVAVEYTTVTSQLTLKSQIDDLIINYPNPVSTIVPGSIKTSEVIKVNSLSADVLHGDISMMSNLNAHGNRIMNLPLPATSTEAASKQYVDGSFLSVNITAGTGLTKLGGTIHLNPAQPGITSVGTLTNLVISGNAIGTLQPSSSLHLANKAYVDSLSYIQIGTGLTRTANVISLNQASITSVGTLTSLTVAGNVTSSAIPTIGSHLVNKTYVDSIIASGSIPLVPVSSPIIAGTGLTRIGDTLNVLSEQPEITLLGTLSSLQVSGNVTCQQQPLIESHLVNKMYVDTELKKLSAGVYNVLLDSSLEFNPSFAIRISSGALGSGLTGGSGVPISVKNNLPLLTGVGTLTSGTWNAAVINVQFGGTGRSSFPTGRLLYGQEGSTELGTSPTLHFDGTRLLVPQITLASSSSTSLVNICRDPAGTSSYNVTLPPAVPNVTSFLKMGTTGSLTCEAGLLIRTFFNGTVPVAKLLAYAGEVTTVNGIATCFPTTTGDAQGSPLFPGKILSISAIPYSDTSKAITVPMASVKSVSPDRKIVTFNVVTGSVAQGSNKETMQLAPNGTVVNVTMFGF